MLFSATKKLRFEDGFHNFQKAYERLKRVNTDNGNSISNADPKDTTTDFFNHCYHFKDWLKKDFIQSILTNYSLNSYKKFVEDYTEDLMESAKTERKDWFLD